MDPRIRDELSQLISAKLKTKPRFVLEEYLFKEQIDFVRDPARFATAVCSVRAGKTTACAADLIDTALTCPGTIGLYITLARSSGKRIVWPELHRINRDFGLDAIFNEAELSVKFRNGSMIYVGGANDAAEIEKYRGLSNVALVYIDEAQAFRSFIKELIEEIIVKRLYDTNGRCRLIGTPGPVPSGYFYEASRSAQWSHHAWTLHNNPWIEKKSGLSVKELIAQDCQRKGVSIEDPSIQRECFGRWVLDTNSLLLNYNPELNHYDDLPKGHYVYILGMDFGFNDADAFAVLGWRTDSPETYLIEELIASGQTYDQLAVSFEALYKKYPFSGMVGDPGGGGKKLIESMNVRYGLMIEPAEKTEKIANYGHLNNALRSGRFKARRDSIFAQDCNLLEIDRDKSTPEKTIVKGHSDIVDGALYAFRKSPAYAYTPPLPKTKPGTPEHDKRIEDQLLEHHISKLEQARSNKEGEINWEMDHNGEPPWAKWSD